MNHGNLSFGKSVLGLLCIVFVMFSLVDVVQARCTGGATNVVYFTGPDNITAPRDVSNGTVLYSERAYMGEASRFECELGDTVPAGFDLDSSRGWSPLFGCTFPLGNSGLSFRIYTEIGGSREPLCPATYVTLTDPSRLYGGLAAGYVTLEISKTGSLEPSGIVNAGALGRVIAGQVSMADINLARGINVVASSCETPDISVAMGEDYKLREFGAPGSTSRDVPFSIKLNNCPKGISRVNYKLQALTPVIDVSKGIVSLNSKSVAAGIGLQIKDGDGVPVPLNTTRRVVGYNASGGDFVIPLLASYYRLATKSFGAGSANTEVTFIMSYL